MSSPGRNRFDAKYYRTFYGSNPVHTPEQVADLASAVIGMAKWWRIDVSSILDVGAGPGYWRDWFSAHRPEIRYQSVDVSAHACRKFGHEQRDISKWSPETPADLVICQGVLHYLSNDAASLAIANLITSTDSLMYLEVPVQEDLDSIIDCSVSDLDAHWRPANWYRTRLLKGFDQAGAGLWVRHGAVRLYHLEGLATNRARSSLRA